MTADAAHVAAVAEAMLGVNIPDDLPLDVEPIEVERFFATVAVETLTPLIEADLRERLAAEVRIDYQEAVATGLYGEEFLRVYLAANETAARIVRGQS